MCSTNANKLIPIIIICVIPGSSLEIYKNQISYSFFSQNLNNWKASSFDSSICKLGPGNNYYTFKINTNLKSSEIRNMLMPCELENIKLHIHLS